MRSKNYKEYIDLLRERPEIPSFESIRELVATHERPVIGGFFGMKRVALLVGGLLVGGVALWAAIPDAQNHSVLRDRSAIGIVQMPAHLLNVFVSKYSEQVTKSQSHNAHLVQTASITTSIEPKATIEATNATKENLLNSTSEPIGAIHSVHFPMPKNAALIADFGNEPILTLPHESDDENHERFSVFLSNSYVLNAVSPLISSQQRFTNGSIGLRYKLNTTSSFSIELRANTFFTAQGHQTVKYRDTTFYHEGQAYPNVLGEITTNVTDAKQSVNWVGVGYRLGFLEIGNWEPFAEVVLGASAEGGIASENLGIAYRLSAPIALGISLRADHLMSGAGVQTTATFESTLSFAW